MGTYVYLTVKVICAVYILYRFRLFLFSRKADGLWDKLYCWARIIRIKMWHRHKKRMYASAEREKHRKICSNRKKDTHAVAPARHCEVIGKTKSVYIPDPKRAVEPVKSEPLPKSDFIGEDEDISADEVDDNLEPVVDRELQDLMALGLCEPDPDFSQAMTYEDLNNMVAMASGANTNTADMARAVETLYSLRQSDIYEFILCESGNKERIEVLMRERFDENDTHHPPLQSPPEAPGFDWSPYV